VARGHSLRPGWPRRHMGGFDARPARLCSRPHALLLRSPGSGRGLHGALAAAAICFAFAERGRGYQRRQGLLDARNHVPRRRAGDTDGFPHGILRRRRRLRDRARATPGAALPDEAGLRDIPAGHGHHRRLRTGFAHDRGDSDDHRRGRGHGRAVHRSVHGRGHRGSHAHQKSVEPGSRHGLCGAPRVRGRLDPGRGARDR